MILIRCNFQTARHQSRTTEAFRSSTRARITTRATQVRSTMRLAISGSAPTTLGTLTFFRQNALTLDAVLAYDPMAGILCLLGDRLFELQLRRRRYRNVPHNHGHQIPGRISVLSESARWLKSAATARTTVQTATTKAKSAVTSRSATSAGARPCFRSTAFTNGKRTP